MVFSIFEETMDAASFWPQSKETDFRLNFAVLVNVIEASMKVEEGKTLYNPQWWEFFLLVPLWKWSGYLLKMLRNKGTGFGTGYCIALYIQNICSSYENPKLTCMSINILFEHKRKESVWYTVELWWPGIISCFWHTKKLVYQVCAFFSCSFNTLLIFSIEIHISWGIVWIFVVEDVYFQAFNCWWEVNQSTIFCCAIIYHYISFCLWEALTAA